MQRYIGLRVRMRKMIMEMKMNSKRFRMKRFTLYRGKKRGFDKEFVKFEEDEEKNKLKKGLLELAAVGNIDKDHKQVPFLAPQIIQPIKEDKDVTTIEPIETFNKE